MNLMSAFRNLRKVFIRVNRGVRRLREVYMSPSRPISRRSSPSPSPALKLPAVCRLP